MLTVTPCWQSIQLRYICIVDQVSSLFCVTNWKPNDRTIRQKCNSTIGCDHFEPIRTNGRKHRIAHIAKQVDIAQLSMFEDTDPLLKIQIYTNMITKTNTQIREHWQIHKYDDDKCPHLVIKSNGSERSSCPLAGGHRHQCLPHLPQVENRNTQIREQIQIRIDESIKIKTFTRE